MTRRTAARRAPASTARAHLATIDASVAQAATDVGGGVRLATVHHPFGNVVGPIQSTARPGG